MMLRQTLLSTCLWLAAGLAAAEENKTEEDMVIYQRRFWHSAAILGDNLYIDGGSMSNHVNNSLPKGVKWKTRAVNTTTIISLKNDWSNSNVEKKEYSYGQTTTGIKIFALWANEKLGQLYRWGGERTDESQVAKDYAVMWYMKKDDDGTWFETPADDKNPPGVSGAHTTCGGKHLYFGGAVSNKTYPRAQVGQVSTGVLEFDPGQRTWQRFANDSHPAPWGSHKMGEAVCLEDLVERPVVLLFGGKSTNLDTGETKTNSMSVVTLYDVETHEWFEQPTTGLPGTTRSEFCAVGAKSKDDTFEIFAYGGDGKGGTQGSLCILTIPGFHWICPTALADSPPRLHHTCVSRKNQMISVGGANSFFNFGDPDQWANGLGILDMTALKWGNDYNASAPDYEAPKLVKEFYADESRQQPEWVSSTVQAMFAKKPEKPDSPDTPGNNTTDSAGDNKKGTDSGEGSGPNVGAIAGGVVGGVLGLALVAFAIWFCLRRKKDSSDEPQPPELAETTVAYPHDHPHHPHHQPHLHDGAHGQQHPGLAASPPVSHITTSRSPLSEHSAEISKGSDGPGDYGVSPPSTTAMHPTYSEAMATKHAPVYHEIAGDVPRTELDGTYTAVSPNGTGTWRPDGW